MTTEFKIFDLLVIDGKIGYILACDLSGGTLELICSNHNERNIMYDSAEKIANEIGINIGSFCGHLYNKSLIFEKYHLSLAVSLNKIKHIKVKENKEK